VGILGPRDIRKRENSDKEKREKKPITEPLKSPSSPSGEKIKISISKPSKKPGRELEEIVEDILNKRDLSLTDKERLRFYYKEKVRNVITNVKNLSMKEKLFVDYGIIDERYLEKDRELKRFLLSQEAKHIERVINLTTYFSKLTSSLHNKVSKESLVNARIKEELDKFFYIMSYISKRDFVYYLPISTTFLKPVSKKECLDAFKRLEKLDVHLYDQVYFRNNPIPDIVLAPGSGNGIYMGDENLFLIPIYPVKSLVDSVITAFVSCRWERDTWGDMRNSYALLSPYKGYNSKKLFFQFLKDYTNFIVREKKGFRVLSNEVNGWFRIHIEMRDIREERRKERLTIRKMDFEKKAKEKVEKNKEKKEIYIPEKKILDLTLEDIIKISTQRKLSIEEKDCLTRLYWNTVVDLLSSISLGEKNTLVLKDKLLLDIGLLSMKFINDNVSYVKNISTLLNSPFDTRGFTFFTFSKYMLHFLKTLKDNEVLHPKSAIEDEITRLKQLTKICGKRNGFLYSPVLSMYRETINPKTAAEILEETLYYDEELNSVYEVKTKGFPPIVFIPGMGNGFYNWGNHSLMIPIIPLKNEVDTVLEGIALLRWDGDRYGEFRFDYSSIKAYKKLKTVDLQRQFIEDYKTWLTRELQGYRAFSTEVRAFFNRRVPSPILKKK